MLTASDRLIEKCLALVCVVVEFVLVEFMGCVVVEFTGAVGVEGVIGITGVTGVTFLLHVLERLTVTSNPAKVPVSIDTVSCFELTSIESLAVSPTLKAAICPASVTVDIRQVAVREEQLVLGDMETCASPLPAGDCIIIIPLLPLMAVHRIAP